MINVIRRVVLAVPVLCLAASVAADSNHPNLSESLVISLDVSAIERHAKSSTPFELAFGDTRLNVVLSPAPLSPKEGMTVIELQRDGKVTERVVQEEFTYAGDVAGEDPKKSEARFSIIRGVLEGYVLSNTGWWFFEPFSRFNEKASADQYLVYAAHHFQGKVEWGDDASPDEVFDPTTSDVEIPLLVVADLEFLTQSGDPFGIEWWEAQKALINNVNGIVFDQVGVRFKLPYGLGDIGNGSLTSTDPFFLLLQLRVFVEQVGGLERFVSHLAHLTTGKDLDGGARTMGWEPGYYGLSRQKEQRHRFLAFENMVAAAHVLGHNFNAVHWEADRVCDPVCKHTIMWPQLERINDPKFSDGMVDPFHNNKQRVCANMISRGFSFVCQ